MRKSLSAFISVNLVAMILVMPTASVWAATSPPTCTPRELSVTVGHWIYGFSAAGTEVQWLPISVTNEGGTCAIGGLPKIAPTGIKVKHKPNGETVYALVEGAAIQGTAYKMLTLAHRKAGYTYLKLEFPVGSTPTAKKWALACEPGTATGFTLNIVPAAHLLNRHVSFTLPDICTTGKANDLSTVALGSAPFQ